MPPAARSETEIRRIAALTRRATGYERDGLATLLLAWQRDALAELHVTPADRFLDVGCATGAAVRQAASQARLAVGVDSSRAMISYARRKSQAQPRTHFVVACAQRLPFPDHAFTAVLCTSALHYLADPTEAMSQMVRVLQPSGRLVIGDFEDLLAPAAIKHRTWLGPALLRRTLTPFGTYLILLAQPK